MEKFKKHLKHYFILSLSLSHSLFFSFFHLSLPLIENYKNNSVSLMPIILVFGVGVMAAMLLPWP